MHVMFPVGRVAAGKTPGAKNGKMTEVEIFVPLMFLASSWND